MSHSHHPIDSQEGDGRIILALAINLLLTLAQIVGGVFSGSLALIADAIHNLSDALALAIAFGARKIGRRPADEAMTFGYERVEIVAALINYTTLIVVGFYLAYEAILRFFDPQKVDGWLVVIVAAIALVIDAATALLTYALSKESINIRAAFLHNVADALGSIAVIVAGTLVILFDWRWVDPIVTLLIAGYILYQSFTEIGGAIRILMLGSPPDLDAGRVLDAMKGIKGVAGVHHLHLWQMQEHKSALDAHVELEHGHWRNADAIKVQLKKVLGNEFDIDHSTLELECARHACQGVTEIGHAMERSAS